MTDSTKVCTYYHPLTMMPVVVVSRSVQGDKMHHCRVCNTDKPEEEFGTRRWKAKGGEQREALENRCRSCERDRWSKGKDGRWRESHYQRTYGISLEDYDRLMEEQHNSCGICGAHQSEFERRFSVDHCHQTGDVRGLLCDGCNTGIGALMEDRDIMEAAIQYLHGP